MWLPLTGRLIGDGGLYNMASHTWWLLLAIGWSDRGPCVTSRLDWAYLHIGDYGDYFLPGIARERASSLYKHFSSLCLHQICYFPIGQSKSQSHPESVWVGTTQRHRYGEEITSHRPLLQPSMTVSEGWLCRLLRWNVTRSGTCHFLACTSSLASHHIPFCCLRGYKVLCFYISGFLCGYNEQRPPA